MEARHAPLLLCRSQLARALSWGYPLLVLLLALLGAWQWWLQQPPWLWLGMAPVVWLACEHDAALSSAALQWRSDGLWVMDAGQHWWPLRPLRRAWVSGLVLTLHGRRDGGRRVRLNIWRDSLPDADYRRLARALRRQR